MALQSAFRQCLVDFDIGVARKAWAEAFPHLPPLGSDEDVVIVLHYARTQTELIEFKHRAWSHGWLTERSYPSGLPDHLKPRAERIYPRIVEAVGIAVGARSELMKPLAAAMQKAMSDAVEECYADGRTEPEFVKQRMREARAAVLRS